MGIVHHATYLTYFEAGRVEWLHKRGISYDGWARAGIHLPVVETHLRYRRPARFDEWLTIETTAAELTRVTIRYAYRVLRGTELICEGDTRLACVSGDMAPKRIPPDIAAILSSGELPPEAWK